MTNNKKAYGYQEGPTEDVKDRNYIADEPGLGLNSEANVVNVLADEGNLPENVPTPQNDFVFQSKLLKRPVK